VKTDEFAEFTSLLRQDLHAHPEVGLHLPRTQEKVLAALDGLPLEIATGSSCSSVIAVLRGGSPGPAVLLRADMDALPVRERTGLSFASTNDAMHACGHDMHTAMLAGAAHLLCARRDQLVGDVVLAFQPGEEGHGGASHMLAEGLLDASGARPVAAYALHVMSFGLQSGTVTGRPGPLMSAADHLQVVVRGSGGHGSAPHRAADPVQAAAAMITALQVAVTREFDVFDPVVITVGVSRAGEAHNVIPQTARFEATVRSFTPQAREKLATVLPRVLRGVALAHGLDVEVALLALFPPTVNHAAEADWAMEQARQTVGSDRVEVLPNPVAASEDFSLVLQQVPGAMLLLGATPSGVDPGTAPYNHAPDADFDDGVLATGARLYASLAEGRLRLTE